MAYNEVQQEKATFVERVLPHMVGWVDSGVMNLEYTATDAPREHESVRIIYRNGFAKHVNVTGDSLKALAIDVLEVL